MRNTFRLGVLGVFSLLVACSQMLGPANKRVDAAALAHAETFVDAFYSFDVPKLEAVLSFAAQSLPEIGFYQGWAEGGNYQVVERFPCEAQGSLLVRCSIAVKDDLMAALGIDFDVTDTFHLSFSEGKIVSVRISSNDLQVFSDAEEWVWRERPELVDKPCEGYFEGGPTPGACVRAMVEGYAEYSKRP
jgi:hypothetical protein